MPKVDLFREVPGYAEAARRERVIRDAPFLGQPEPVCGFLCAPLTLRRVLWLQLVNSPFLADIDDADTHEIIITKPDLANDLFLFFWIVSPEFQAGNQRKQAKFFKRMKPLMKQKLGDVLKEVADYMREAFMDAGEGERGKSFYSSAASLVAFMQKNHGLDCDVWENSWLRNLVRRITGKPNPLDVPLKIAWQFMRAHRAASVPDCIFTNKFSDGVVNRHLKELNAATN